VATVASPPATRATRDAVRATLLGVLLLIALACVARLVYSIFTHGISAWFDEELNPLLGLLVNGQAIEHIDPRQYGVVVFLVLDPVVRAFGGNLSVLATYTAFLSLVTAVVAFVLMARRYASDDPARLLILLIAWSASVPLLYVAAQHQVDVWQLMFLSASLFLFTGTQRQRQLAGVPLAFATLTKLLPALLLVYLFVRAWRVALIGLAAIALLLLTGQVLYGSLMGIGYPLAILSSGADAASRWSMHFENNSVRGLLFKVAAGFRLQGDTTAYVLDSSWVPWLSGIAYLLALALVGYLLWAAWRGRHDQSIARRSIEFSLAIVTMLLISPHTAQEFLVSALPVLAVWLWLYACKLPRPWTAAETGLGIAAAVLVGVFLPMNLVARLVPFNWLLNVTHNAGNTLFVDQIGSSIGVYEFFGLPGLGLLLAWLLLVWLERQSARMPASQ
jgi:hypothetical protein